MVDAVLDDAIEGVGEFFLVDVVLILANADGARVDFHEFGQRVLHAARDGNGAAQGGIEVRKFFSGQRRSRIHRSAGFADDVPATILPPFENAGDEAFALAGGGAIADGHKGDVVAVDELAQGVFGFGFAAFAFERINNGRFQHVAGGVNNGQLTAVGKPRIETKHDVAAHRRLQEQIAQVFLKEHGGLVLGPFAAGFAHFFFEGWLEQAAPTVAARFLQTFLPNHAFAIDVFVKQIDGALFVGLQAYRKGFVAFGTADGVHAVRRHFGQGFTVVEIVVISRIGLLAGFGVNDAMLRQLFAQAGAHVGVVGKAFCEDVAGTGEGSFAIGKFVARCGQLFCKGSERCGGFAGQPGICQWRQAARLCLAGACLTLWPVRAIEIIEGGQGVGGGDFFRQRRCEFALLSDEALHIGAPRFQFAQPVETVGESAHRLVVEAACLVLAIAGDERHRRAFIQQGHRALHMLRIHFKFFCQSFVDRQSPTLPSQFVLLYAMHRRSRKHENRRAISPAAVRNAG